jgi:putative oxidoreductase
MIANDTVAPPMSPVATVGRALGFAQRLPMGLPLLLARIGIAAVFFRSGLTKLDNWMLTVQLFKDEYRVPLLPPEIAAYLATFNELVLPAFILAGLATRLAALPLLGMTLVIQLFVYPSSWVDHTMWAALLTLLIARGAGALSLDHLIRRHVSA